MVWRTARLLDEALAGRVLTHTDFRVPRFATTDLTGRAVTETVSRGKHLLTRVDGGLTVHTHLRMDGSWRIRPAGGYPQRDHRITGPCGERIAARAGSTGLVARPARTPDAGGG